MDRGRSLAIVVPFLPKIKSNMGAPTSFFRTCLAKVASSSVFAAPIQEVCLGCGKKLTAGLNFGAGRLRGDALRCGQFTSGARSGFRIQQQDGQSGASPQSQACPETVRAPRRSKVSKASRRLVTLATEEIVQYGNPETEDQLHLTGMVDEVESVDDDMEEELAAMTDSIGLTGTVPVVSNSVCVGIDPDLSGAIAVLKSRDNCTVAEVIDVPCITVAVNKRMRRRHDYQSIAAIVKQLQAPEGSIAYVERAMPFPKDGKQGWYLTGYGYGVWLGILAAAGFTVIPVQAKVWKTAMGLCGKEFTKDDSRAVASSMFPVLSAQLRRKKDHGRAEALLIAAFGKGMTLTEVASSFDEPRSSNEVESPNQSPSFTENFIIT